VRAAALGLLSCLCADEASVGSVEAARAVPLLVALCGTASEMPREVESTASIAPGEHAEGPVADAAAAAATPLLEPPPAPTDIVTVGNAAAAAAAAAPRRRLAAASLAVFSLGSKAHRGSGGAAEAKALGLAEARQQAAATARCVELAVCCLAQLMT
jgi:hypothetical protein